VTPTDDGAFGIGRVVVEVEVVVGRTVVVVVDVVVVDVVVVDVVVAAVTTPLLGGAT
jgi:hypothetical protein